MKWDGFFLVSLTTAASGSVWWCWVASLFAFTAGHDLLMTRDTTFVCVTISSSLNIAVCVG